MSASYNGRTPASARASAAARGSSKKSATKCELVLRKALWAAGLRYRKNAADLPGKPDLVFRGAKLAIFCDGDFWHGRDWPARKKKLSAGSNATYWIEKIERNIARDAENNRQLRLRGWKVVRFWEKDILNATRRIAAQISHLLAIAKQQPN